MPENRWSAGEDRPGGGGTAPCCAGRGTVDDATARSTRECRMLEFLTLVALVVLVLVGLLVTAVCLLLRRIRRSRLVVAGTRLVADGMLAVAACRPRPTPHRTAAVQALRVFRAHRELRERIDAAQRAGAHLGDVPAVLPRLEAEGRRLRAALGRLVGSATPGEELLARADRHLATVADLIEVVDVAAQVPALDDTLARDVEEAALGLRLHTAAYDELTAPDRVPGQRTR